MPTLYGLYVHNAVFVWMSLKRNSYLSRWWWLTDGVILFIYFWRVCVSVSPLGSVFFLLPILIGWLAQYELKLLLFEYWAVSIVNLSSARERHFQTVYKFYLINFLPQLSGLCRLLLWELIDWSYFIHLEGNWSLALELPGKDAAYLWDLR